MWGAYRRQVDIEDLSVQDPRAPHGLGPGWAFQSQAILYCLVDLVDGAEESGRTCRPS